MSARRGPEAVVTRLREILDRRAYLEADLRPRRVVGREKDGTEILLPLDGECPERGSTGARAVGQVTLLPAPSPYRSRGAAGVAPLAVVGAADVLWLERQEPEVLERGTTAEVTLHGRGFRDPLFFRYLLPGGLEPHPGLTIEGSTFVDAETYRLEVRVAADARLVTGAPIAYSREPIA